MSITVESAGAARYRSAGRGITQENVFCLQFRPALLRPECVLGDVVRNKAKIRVKAALLGGDGRQPQENTRKLEARVGVK